MTEINFISVAEYNATTPQTDGEIVIDTLNAVVQTPQTVHYLGANPPLISIKNGLNVTVKSSGDFVADTLCLYHFYYSSGGFVVLNIQPVLDLEMPVPTQEVIFEDDFQGTVINGQKWNITDNPNIDLSQNDELIFTDSNTVTSGAAMTKVDTINLFQFDTTGKILHIDFEVERNLTDATNLTVFLVSGSNDKIVWNSDTNNNTGVYFMIAENNVYHTTTDTGENPSGEFRIILDSNNVTLQKLSTGIYTTIATGVFTDGTYYVQIHRSKQAVAGATNKIKYFKITEIA